uniref:Uncharacterized protein n=1 Tax=Pararge aegeria TaxID=116150 RepID=S4P387_9NEOP
MNLDTYGERAFIRQTIRTFGLMCETSLSFGSINPVMQSPAHTEIPCQKKYGEVDAGENQESRNSEYG